MLLGRRPSLSLRAQLTLMLVSVALGVAGIVGYLSYRSGRRIIHQDAFRIVAAVAEGRHHLLVRVLDGQFDRVGAYLDATPDGCASSACLRAEEERLLTKERAAAAVLTLRGEAPIAVGSTALLVDLPPPDPTVLAQPFRDPDNNAFFYVITRARPGRGSIRVVWRAATLDELFGPDPQLGRSGETFLTDGRGFFMTPDRSALEHGVSHPVEEGPMLGCLGGKNAAVVGVDKRDALIIHGFRYVQEIGGGCIMAHVDVGDAFAPVRELERKTAGIALAASMAALVIGLLLARRLTRPLATLSACAAAVRGGEPAVIPALAGPREIEQLGKAFAAMTRRLDEWEEVRERFIGILAHDLRSPLTSAALAIEVLKRRGAELPSDVGRSLQLVAKSTARMGRMISDLLDFARSRRREGIPVNPCPGDLGRLASETVEGLRLAHPGRVIEVSVEDDAAAPADPDRAAQVVTNLVENALRYGPPERPVTVRVAGRERDVELSVQNAGPTIAPEELASVFDPFRRGRQPEGTPDHGGLGLGLYIVVQILRGHGGRVTATSTDAEGTVFSTFWPRAPTA
ncbi:MAG TPA: HAMP domain-containing sensor histidine kinase [Polyangia bacterium]|nr:HAMP domain-containing sensor histidine kinase [Polyangia bacterium]